MALHVSSLRALVLLVSAACVLWGANDSRAQPPPEQLAGYRAAIEKWLADAGLSRLELLKLRFTEHPAPVAGRKGYRLELRFVSTTFEEASARAEFKDFVKAQSDKAGRPFTTECFYRLVHLLGIDRESASVHFYVLETEYATYFDPASREIIVEERTLRSVRRQTSIALANPQTEPDRARSNAAGVVVARRGNAEPVHQTIQRLLEARFTAARTAAAAKPTLRWRSVEPDYLQASIVGLKGEVISAHKYWEKLGISIELKKGAGDLTLVCYFEGHYASGLGSNPPADDSYYIMEERFRTELEDYAEDVLRVLRQALSPPR